MKLFKISRVKRGGISQLHLHLRLPNCLFHESFPSKMCNGHVHYFEIGQHTSLRLGSTRITNSWSVTLCLQVAGSTVKPDYPNTLPLSFSARDEISYVTD